MCNDGDLDLPACYGENIKRWQCSGLTLYIVKGSNFDAIDFDGLKERILARYSIDGLGQFWMWQEEESTEGMVHAVILTQGVSGLVAKYYDIIDGKPVDPSSIFLIAAS